ncbi:MAG TPA: MFS transporter [Urbifossiella sp.]|nr:MFS transporter [Urbifossiella sp.]
MSERPTRVRWRVVALLTGLVFLAHFNRVGISVAANAHFIGPGRLSAEQMGLVYSAFLLVYTLLMLPGGYLLDRVGPRRAMTAMAVGLGFWAALTGVLGWTGLGIAAMFVPLLLIRGLAGATSVPLHPGAARAVSLWVPPGERSTANGTVTAGALVGIALTYPVFGWLMDAVGWPAAFVVCGAALALLGVGWYALAADSPAEHARTNAAERELVADNPPPRATATFAEVAALLRDRSLVLLTLSYGALGYMQYLFFYWIEFYFGKVLKLPDSESRRAAFVVMMASAAGMALGGRASDRLGRVLGSRAGNRVVAVTGMSLSAAFSLCGVAATDPDAVVAWFALGLGALGLCEGIFWTTAPALAPRNGGLACALVNTGGNGVGLLAPVVTPLLGEAYGWTTAVAVGCAVCFAGGLLWLGVTDRHRGDDVRA